MHEVRAIRERKKKSVWFRELVENCVVYGDRGLWRIVWCMEIGAIGVVKV